MVGKRLTLCFVLLMSISTAVSGAVNSVKSTQEDELVFSILPFLSPVALMKRFMPLRKYLENSTGVTIQLESATSFAEYLRRTMNHEYDIVYTAPHFVPFTLRDNHYELLAASNEIAAHIIVLKSGKITKIADLAGKRISHGPEQAFLVIIAKRLLKHKGLTGERSPIFIQHKSHNAALRAVTGDEADAAIVGTFLLKQAAENGLREIAATPFYPGIAILASKKLPKSFRNKLAKSFVTIKSSKAGRETLKRIRFPGFKSATAVDYESLKPIAHDVIDPDTFELIR